MFFCFVFFFFFNDTATTEIYTLSLHDALPILSALRQAAAAAQSLLAIADAAWDPLPDMLRPHLPKPGKLTLAQCPIPCAAPSLKEQLARKSADRYCPNRMAACS